MSKTKEQLYFKSIDDPFCKPLDDFLQEAKLQGLKEIKLIKAVKDKDTKDYIFCAEAGEITERCMCKKAECSSYHSKSGRGVCSYRGQLYLHDDEVVIDVVLGKEITASCLVCNENDDLPNFKCAKENCPYTI